MDEFHPNRLVAFHQSVVDNILFVPWRLGTVAMDTQMALVVAFTKGTRGCALVKCLLGAKSQIQFVHSRVCPDLGAVNLFFTFLRNTGWLMDVL